MLLAISSLGGANASKEMTNANILASDSWAFYQAKNIRQTELRIAVDQTRVSLAQGGLTQIAIVLGSVSIVANSRQLLALAVALGGAATVLLLNGFFLIAPLFALR